MFGKKLWAIITGILVMGSSSFLYAQTTADDKIKTDKEKFIEVIQLAKQAADYLSKTGKEGLSAISDPDGPWVRGDLYVFVYGIEGDEKGVIIGHPREGLVGKNFLKVRDKRQKVFAADFLRIALSEAREGWSEYWWPKLEDSNPEPKLSYIVRVPGQPMLVGVGIYGGYTKDQVETLLSD